MLRGDSSYIVDTRGETRRNIRPKTTKRGFFFLEVASYLESLHRRKGGGGGGRSSIAVIRSTLKAAKEGFGTCCYTAPARGTVFIYPLSCVSGGREANGCWVRFFDFYSKVSRSLLFFSCCGNKRARAHALVGHLCACVEKGRSRARLPWVLVGAIGPGLAVLGGLLHGVHDLGVLLLEGHVAENKRKN